MQDFGAIPGLARRVLGAAPGGGGERLRGYTPPASGQPPAPVKCPRCDSTNTKFCYYNNYNLAQPRHFCKSCRRYWTKGGVLRNVPVGGGCRKSKRSASSSSSFRSSAVAHKDLPRRPSNSARSGSGGSCSSTLASAEASSSTSFPLPTLVTPHPGPDPDSAASLDPAIGMEAPLVRTAEIFADTSTTAATGTFTSLIPPAAAPEMLGFDSLPDPLQAPLPLPLQPNAAEEIGAQQRFANQPCAGGGAGWGLAGIDWPGASMDPALFDLAAAVDPAAAAYWSHGHWGDGDPALYLP